jgi:formylglycine-generating enzyme required for sulfatase activity
MNRMTHELPQYELCWKDAGIRMAFRLIPAGSFRMGSRGYYNEEEPVHKVCITQPFWMAETPVTQAQFALWTRSEGIEHKNELEGKPKHPAENMDWRQAQEFCRWLTWTKLQEFPEGCGIACLPTEAEWEYACRAGTETEYYTGDGEAALMEAGWFNEDLDSGLTHAVAARTPNNFGLFDMHGNVWEWCHDVWDGAPYRGRVDGVENPGWQERSNEWNIDIETLKEDNRDRVLRGGSWDKSCQGLPVGVSLRELACRSLQVPSAFVSVWFAVRQPE